MWLTVQFLLTTNMEVRGPTDLRLKHGTSMQICGMSRAGKSQLALQIALNRDKVYDKRQERCVFLYNQYQSAVDDIKNKDDSILFTNDIDKLEEVISEERGGLLVILDDFLLQMQSSLNEYISIFCAQDPSRKSVSDTLTTGFIC